jgi:hypothetical protein
MVSRFLFPLRHVRSLRIPLLLFCRSSRRLPSAHAKSSKSIT